MRLLGGNERPLQPSADLVPDVELEVDDVAPDEGDADGQEEQREQAKTKRRRGGR